MFRPERLGVFGKDLDGRLGGGDIRVGVINDAS